MTTYRTAIRRLDRSATPGPWSSEGELYGVTEHGAFMPLGFAPHRPLDCHLIAVYRSAVMDLIKAVDAVERLAQRAIADPATGAAVGIAQVLSILDATVADPSGYRGTLLELDRRTTPPPWDPGHLFLGMDFDPKLRSIGIATPQPADPHLIAVARIAVPRALELLAFVEQQITQCSGRDGSMSTRAAVAIVATTAAFDRHRADEGSGTGTV